MCHYSFLDNFLSVQISEGRNREADSVLRAGIMRAAVNVSMEMRGAHLSGFANWFADCDAAVSKVFWFWLFVLTIELCWRGWIITS